MGFNLVGLRLIMITLLLSGCSHGLKPFASDGCSSFPDGTFAQNQLWLACCVEHDLAYWKGGTKAERELADLALEKCVVSVGEQQIAKLMLAGVRVGGTPYLPTTFRWGYGWPYPRSYGPLTDDELKAIEKATSEYQQQLQKTQQIPQ
ncbi:MAG: FAD-binding oxidoreductase [Pontibacterium sp.]